MSAIVTGCLVLFWAMGCAAYMLGLAGIRRAQRNLELERQHAEARRHAVHRHPVSTPRPAGPDDHPYILGLIGERAHWMADHPGQEVPW